MMLARQTVARRVKTCPCFTRDFRLDYTPPANGSGEQPSPTCEIAWAAVELMYNGGVKKTIYQAYLYALLAAVLFGISTPLAKLLLGEIDSIALAALLYLGSGLGALACMAALRVGHGGQASEAALTRPDLPWLAGAVLAGGVAAPIILMISLKHTPAASASLLLNFEGVATTLIAAWIFKEAVGRRIAAAVLLVMLASLLLSLENNGVWGFSLGALGILATCILWGVDNNFTRRISARNPLQIVAVKGIGAGSVSLVITYVLGQKLPSPGGILAGMLLGLLCYGFSIGFFVLAMRTLGSARTSTLFAAAPFVGAAFSVAIFRDPLPSLLAIALLLMLAGAGLMLVEDHQHRHLHAQAAHEHRHQHPDEHHTHTHPEPIGESLTHSHWHAHPELAHSHTHTPDLHHHHSHPA
jgi:drug/metabolite transporter (DMT)-like permease